MSSERPAPPSPSINELVDRAERVRAMLARWAAESVTDEPDWNVEDVEPLGVERSPSDQPRKRDCSRTQDSSGQSAIRESIRMCGFSSPTRSAKHEILLSEIADYELRHELLRIRATRSLARLDELSRELRYVPVTTAMWRHAASLGAWSRRTGRATSSEHAPDGDVLIAAQAIAEDAVVVTTNPRHFQAWVRAFEWNVLIV